MPQAPRVHGSRSRRRGSTTTTVAAAALVLAACLGKGSGSMPSGYPGGGGVHPAQQTGYPEGPARGRPDQPSSGGGGYPRQQQQQQQPQQFQQQYRQGGPSQARSPTSHGHPSGGQPPSTGGVSSGDPQGGVYGRGPDPRGYRGGPPSGLQQQQPPQNYGQQAPQGRGEGQGGGGGGGGGYGGGGYPGGQQAGYGRPSYASQGMPQQQQQQPGGDGGGLLSRLTNKIKGMDGQPAGRPPQGYGSRYGGGQQPSSQGSPPQGWQQQQQQQQQQPRPGLALQPTGPSRGPIQSGYQGQDGGYGGGGGRQQPQQQHQHQDPRQQQQQHHSQQQHSQQQQPGGGGDGGIWSRFKGKVFQGDTGGVDERPPSFRPSGSTLKKRDDSAANGNIQSLGGPGAFGNPYPSFGGPLGMGMGQAGGGTPEPSGPGVAEVVAVDTSIVMILKPNEFAKKKRKFKQDGSNRLQVITTFDHCLTAFHAKDGKASCLKTTDVLEQNQHVMLPEAAKKVRYLRSDFKRRMEADGKNMSPEERVAALEDNLRKVYSVVAMEGGVHMNSIGPAIEAQLDSIPLRDGVDDMTAALAWRAIPMTIFCAGYGNVAMEVLRRGSPKITGPGGVFSPHLRLVANFFRPDDTMTIIGMYDTVPLIHEAKKSGATLMEFLRGVRQENAFASRSNVLLLGSELSDLGLSTGLPAVEERISVGFLKLDEHVLDKLPRYAQAYDVVIVGDGDMSYTNEILHEILE